MAASVLGNDIPSGASQPAAQRLPQGTATKQGMVRIGAHAPALRGAQRGDPSGARQTL